MNHLYGFQRRGVDWLLEKRRILLADDPGCGKTAQAIVTVKEAGLRPALVVCPAYLQANWVREISQWDPGVYIERIGVSDSGARLVGAPWAVLSYEAMVAKARVIKNHMKPAAVVFDESHYLKNPTSERTRAAVGAASPAELRLLLSGTPVLNSPEEIWSQLCVLGVHDRFCHGDYEEFMDFYEHAPPDRRANRLEVLNASLSLKGVYLRRSKDQVLPDLPPLMRAYVPLELEDTLDLTGADGPDGERLAVALAKLPQVFEWLDDFRMGGRPVVVFAHHRQVVAAIAEHLGVPALTGETPPDERQVEVDRFQAGARNAIVFSLHAGQCGYTLTRASDVVFAQEDWVPAVVEQAAARCHRIGQQSSVTEWHLIAPGTVEERMFRLLDRKVATTSAVIDGASKPGSMQQEFEAAKGS